MASVWLERKGKAPKKLAGNLHPVDAIKFYHGTVEKWSGTVCKPKSIGLCAVLHYRTDAEEAKAGGPFGILYVEPCSPPSKPEAGQPCRRKKAQP